jgi:hypothetical protein
MSRRITPRRLTAARSQELQVAAAVAREAVVQLHADHALDLIRCASGRVAELRMLDIYSRLLELSGPAEEVVANRVLAALGRTRAASAAAGTFREAEGDDVAADDHSLLRTLRRRLRGRVHDVLRRTVELRVGVVNAALLELHVTHACGFVALLDGSRGIVEACRRYRELVPMPSSLAGVLYLLVLDRLAAGEGSAAWPAACRGDTEADEPAHGTRRGKWRDVDHGGRENTSNRTEKRSAGTGSGTRVMVTSAGENSLEVAASVQLLQDGH